MSNDLYRLMQRYGIGSRPMMFANGGMVEDDIPPPPTYNVYQNGPPPPENIPLPRGPVAVPTVAAPMDAPMPGAPVMPAPPPPPREDMVVATSPVAGPVAPATSPPPAAAPATPVAPPSREQTLAELMQRYSGGSDQYTRELAESRRRYQAESEAFSNMIRQMSERGESPSSRAEMYFRLAAAFGSPTRTGMFTENLALAGREMGEYLKGRRAGESERRNLALQAQQMRLTGAREDLATTRALAAQEGSERRATQSAILREYLASGRPQSEAGKLAEDAGLRPGTPEHAQFVQRWINSRIENGDIMRMMALDIQRQGLELRQQGEARAAAAARQLTPTELRMRQESEDTLSASRNALRNIERALEINDNTYGTSIIGEAQYQSLYRAGSENPRVLNTAEIRNILSEAAINRLRESFGSQITDSERAALQELQGALSRTPAERRRILERTREQLQRSLEREQRRLRDITSGAYRQQTPSGESPSGEGNTP